MSALRSVLTAACYVAVSATILPIPGFCQWQPCGTGGPVQCAPNGNVGIGTTSPGAAYNGVSGATTSPVLDLKSPNPASATLLRLISAPSTGGSYAAGIEFDANDTVNANQSYNAGRIYGIFDAPVWPAGRLTLSTPAGAGVWTDTMTLKNGAVGMGTTDPCTNAASASVPNCKLSVNGGIQAQAVVVNSNWSDYVFAPDYRLPPLSEVADYIKDNHHLPGIPSESEVQQSGVSLGDMQSKLLAKIEELTLHMIQANEKNEQLEQRNRDLEQRLARLETALGDRK